MESGKELTKTEWMIEPKLWLKLAVLTARVLRKADWNGAVGVFRRRAARGYFQFLHLRVIHALRRVAVLTCQGGKQASELHSARTAFCTALQEFLAEVLELNRHELNCCFKVLERGRTRPADRVRTIARSEPLDGRATHDESAHLVGENTVWSALLGGHDGFQKWRPVNCFCCNDLTHHKEAFRNTRQGWQEYYRSALVFPLRYVDAADPGKFDTVGFLAIDSVKTGIFKEMPDVFDSGANWAAYHDSLFKSTPFHAGAAVADILSMALRPHYEKTAKRN